MNIFNEEVEAIINPCNIIGVSGAGLSKDFKNRFPRNEELYKHACKDKTIDIGKCLITKEDDLFIVNFPTKLHYKNPSKLEYIEKGLISLVSIIDENNIKSIAIPKLGCGLGKLNWKDVKPLILKYLTPLINNGLILKMEK